MHRQQVVWVGIVVVLVLSCSLGCGMCIPPAASEEQAATAAPARTTATSQPPTETASDSDGSGAFGTPIVTGAWRITGTDVPELASFDDTMRAFMQEHGISAGALAVTYEGRLIMAHGYTWDEDQSYATQPTSLFRIASLSKPVTAAAVLNLIEEGQLDLDTRITDVLTFIAPEGQSLDPRLDEVTVAHLLYHQGGWDIDALGYDPMFHDFQIAGSLGVPLPISQADIMAYMSGVPLSYDPGTQYAYSNYGYMLLGRIIEAVSGQPYETNVKQQVLAPLGVTHMQLGRSLPEDRLPGEVAYHSDFVGPTVFDVSGTLVPWPDGGWNLENMDAHGGWVADVIDMARFSASFDQPASHPVLTQESIATMFAPPPGTVDEGYYYAMGWEVRSFGDGAMTTWHSGSLDGTLTLMVRRYDGVGWVVFFNERESESDPSGDGYWEIDDLLHGAADAVRSWPDNDLF